MIQPPYTTGTATVTASSPVVTGQTTAWVLGLVNGGLFTRQGLAVPILSVESDTSLTLAYPWPGATGTGAYAIDLGRADAASSIVATRRLAELLVEMRGPLVEFRESPDGVWVQYRNGGTDEPWVNLITVAELMGPPASFAEVVTQTLAAGSNATFQVTETAPGVFRLNIGIPRGNTGAPGELSQATADGRYLQQNVAIPAALIPADLTPDKAFRRANILGTVSHASNVPTGALIEVGSNANGYYEKYASGLLVCLSQLQVFLDTQSFQTRNLPATFLSISAHSTSISFASAATGGDSNVWYDGVNRVTVHNLSASALGILLRGTPVVASGTAYLTTVGRWK